MRASKRSPLRARASLRSTGGLRGRRKAGDLSRRQPLGVAATLLALKRDSQHRFPADIMIPAPSPIEARGAHPSAVVVATTAVMGHRRRDGTLNRLWHRVNAFPLWGSLSMSAVVDSRSIPASAGVSFLCRLPPLTAHCRQQFVDACRSVVPSDKRQPSDDRSSDRGLSSAHLRLRH